MSLSHGKSGGQGVSSANRGRTGGLRAVWRRVCLGSALAAGLAAMGILPAPAQTSKGSLTGEVRDSSGLVIVNAKVTATAENGGDRRTTTTSSLGAYRIDAVTPGPYTIRVEATGFAPLEVQHIYAAPSVVTSYDAALRAGDVQTVTVEAGGNLLNLENSTIAGTIGAQQLNDLPSFTQNPVELTTTLPGVQIVDQNLALNGLGGNGFQIEVNGARPRGNNFMIDGQDINDIGIAGQAFQPAIADAFETETVLMSVAPAEYGRGSGAIVNLVTKSGTNTFHGTAWEMYQGSGLDSLDGVTRRGKPFAAGANPKARYDIHQQGFTIGGPILKGKLFGEGAGWWSRYYGMGTGNAVELPDAAGYAQLQAIGGPQVALLDQYIINGSYMSTYANLGAGAGMRVSSRSGCTGGCKVTTAIFQRPPVEIQNPDTQFMVRFDYHPTDADVLTYRYLRDNLTLTPDLDLNQPGLPGFDGTVNGPSAVQQATWTHVLSSTLVNELRVSATRIDFLFEPTPEALANPIASYPTLVFSGSGFASTGLGLAQDIPQGRADDTYQLQETLSWVHGRHNVRVGGDIGRQIARDLIPQGSIGELVFTAGGALSPLDNFLDNYLGRSGQAIKSFGPRRADPHSWRLGLFGQDNVKLRPTLTLNLGIRYDYLTPPENSLPYPAIDIDNPFQAIDTVVREQSDRNNFSPRVGFVWNPEWGWFHDRMTVIHGGLAAFYDTDFLNILENAAESAPNAPTPIITSTTGRGVGNATGLLATMSPTLSPTNSVQSQSNKMVNPMTWQYNFGMQRRLPGNIGATINYVGAVGENLYANQQLNYFVNGKRLAPTRGPINIRSNRAASNYNALQVDVTRKFQHGLFFQANYTWSKDLDDNSEVFSTFAAPTAYSADLTANNLHADWGPSVWDRRHVFSLAYSWTPDGFRSDNGALDGLLSATTRHWTLSGTTQLQSGPYTTFNFDGVDSNGDGSAQNDRPILGNPNKPLDTAGFDGAFFGAPFHAGTYYDYVTGDPVTADDEHWLVPATNGYDPREIGRNSFENPGVEYWNIALQKEVPTSWLRFDRGSFLFRAEVQNFTNHNSLGPLDINLLDIGTPDYMSRTNAIEGTNRHMQLWAKFRFARAMICPWP